MGIITTTAKQLDRSTRCLSTILSSLRRAPKLLNHYLRDANSDFDMTTFENGIRRDLIQPAIDAATSEDRPLLVVSREDRAVLSPADQAWFYSQFALVTSIETPRYDYRRHRMAIYEYRPAVQPDCETRINPASEAEAQGAAAVP